MARRNNRPGDEKRRFEGAKLTRGAAVYIVTQGEGELLGDGYSRNIKAGNYFFLPAEAKGFSIRGDVQFVCCQGGE